MDNLDGHQRQKGVVRCQRKIQGMNTWIFLLSYDLGPHPCYQVQYRRLCICYIYKVERLREREGGKILSLSQKTRERGKEPEKMTAKKTQGLFLYIPFTFPTANTHAVVCQTMIQYAPLLQFRHLQRTGIQVFKKKILLKLSY